MAFERVSRVEEIPRGGTRFFTVRNRPVLLSNRHGTIHAHYGRCPHQGNTLEGARLWDNLLTCPWHQFQYDIRTGENVYPRNVYPADLSHLDRQLLPLRTYPVEVRGGEVWVDL